MRHRNVKKILSRKKEPRRALLRGLATSLVLYERIKTTKAKAKSLRQVAEKIITLGKNNTLTSRRRLLKILYTKKSANKILEVLAPKYKDRNGGYTRIVPVGQRFGDGAEMVYIEFI